MLKKIAFFLIFVIPATQAEIVKYLTHGQLSHLTQPNTYYYQTDLYKLDGANYTRVLVVDASVPPSGFFSNETTQWWADDVENFLISNTYYITDRPDNEMNIILESDMPNTIFSIQNAGSETRDYDAVVLGGSQLTGTLNDLFASDEWISFKGNYFAGKYGYITQPPYVIGNSEVLQINANVFNFAPNGSTGTIDGKYLSYKQTVFCANASNIDSPFASLDLDGNGQYDALTDGLLFLRSMFGINGAAFVNDILASNALYNSEEDIKERIDFLGNDIDIDGNGTVDALTDGIILMRYLFGIRGEVLLNGAIAADATISSAESVSTNIKCLMLPIYNEL